MAVEVETYEVPEVAGCDGKPEDEAEAISLIESLGLEGQRTLIDKDKGERFPYRMMTREEVEVYEVLLPEHEDLEKYQDAAIPLRVLQIAAHAKTAKLDGKTFRKIEVWHAPNPQVKDPLLVGLSKEQYEWQSRRFILARWGDALLPLAELKALAQKLRFAEIKTKLTEIIAEAQGKLAGLTEDTALGRAVPSATF